MERDQNLAFNLSSFLGPSLTGIHIPGVSLVFNWILHYLNVDISSYMPALVVLCAVSAGSGLKLKHIGLCLWNQATASIEIPASCGEPYEAIQSLVDNILCPATKHVLARTATGGITTVDDEEYVSEGDNPSVRYFRHVSFTPAVGVHIFFYHYLPCLLIRKDIREGWIRTESLCLITVSWRRSSLRKLLHEARLAYADRDKNMTAIYQHQEEYGRVLWYRSQTSQIRKLSTIIINTVKKDELINDIRKYLQPGEQYLYAKCGIPYRRGYLFFGPPGTGKTSLCHAAAGVFGLPIYCMNLGSLTENGFSKLMSTLPKRCMLLLEDIDQSGLTIAPTSDQPDNTSVKEPNVGYQKEGGKSRISLATVLNAFDGLGAIEGRVLILTTNNPGNLNDALIRAGRIDRKIEFSYTGRDEAKGLFSLMYSTDNCHSTGLSSLQSPVGSIVSKDRLEILAEEFAEAFSGITMRPKEIQDYLLDYLHDPEEAVRMVNDWVEKKRQETQGEASQFRVPSWKADTLLPALRYLRNFVEIPYPLDMFNN